jgi:hypothetical protein
MDTGVLAERAADGLVSFPGLLIEQSVPDHSAKQLRCHALDEDETKNDPHAQHGQPVLQVVAA